jgi:hypothetical protein
MSQTASTLLLRNLHDVFGEIDPVRRRAAIDEIFHENAVFYEPNSAYRGRDEIGQRSMSTIRMCGCVWSTDGHPSTPRSHQQSSSRRALRREVSCDTVIMQRLQNTRSFTFQEITKTTPT